MTEENLPRFTPQGFAPFRPRTSVPASLGGCSTTWKVVWPGQMRKSDDSGWGYCFHTPKTRKQKQQKKRKQQQNRNNQKHQRHTAHRLFTAVLPSELICPFKILTSHTSDFRSRGTEVPGKHCSAESAGNFVAFRYKEKSSNRPPREAPCSATHFKYGCWSGMRVNSSYEAFKLATLSKRQIVVPQSTNEETPGGKVILESLGFVTIGSCLPAVVKPDKWSINSPVDSS